MTSTATITPEKIREGDPEALAALCRRGGAAMFAYCEHVAATGHSIHAVADAFARFRAAIVGGEGLTARDADTLLRRMTRRAAASCGVNTVAARHGHPFSESCEGPETELVPYVEEELSRAERDRVTAHVARCSSCTAALQRLQAGERALSRPPIAPLPQGFAELLLDALVVAAPVLAHDGNRASVRAAALRLIVNGAGASADIPQAPLPVQSSLEAPLPAIVPDRGAGPEPQPLAAPAPPPIAPDPEPLAALAPPPIAPDPEPLAAPAPAAIAPDPAPTDAATPARGRRGRRERARATPGRAKRRRPQRLVRSAQPWVGDPVLRHRSAALVRGAARLLGVVILAAAGGVLLGIAVAELAG